METKDFKKLWDEFLKRNPNKKDLVYIATNFEHLRQDACLKLLSEEDYDKEDLFFIINEAKGLREAAWIKYLEKNPSKKDLKLIVKRGGEFLKEKAGEEILKRSPEKEDLYFVIQNIPALREKAGILLLKRQDINKKDLYFVIDFISLLKTRAGLMLLALNPTNDDLIFLLERVESLRKRIWEEFFSKSQSKNERELKEIIKFIPQLREEAIALLLKKFPSNWNLRFAIKWIDSKEKKEELAEILLEKNPTQDDMIFILERVESFRNIVWEKLQEKKISNGDLRYIIRWFFSLREEAGKILLYKNPDKKDLECIIKLVPSPSLKEEAAKKILFQNPNKEDLLFILKMINSEIIKKEAGSLLLSKKLSDKELEFVANSVPSLRQDVENILAKRGKKQIMRLIIKSRLI